LPREEKQPLEVEQKKLFEFRMYQARTLAKQNGVHLADWLLAEMGHDPIRIAHLVGAPDQRLRDVIARYRRWIYEQVEKSRNQLMRLELTVTQCNAVLLRLKKAKETREAFDTFVNALYDAPGKPGWMWKDEKTISFVAERFPDYKPGTIRQLLKSTRAKYRNRPK
jgi:hypothetical protein